MVCAAQAYVYLAWVIARLYDIHAARLPFLVHGHYNRVVVTCRPCLKQIAHGIRQSTLGRQKPANIRFLQVMRVRTGYKIHAKVGHFLAMVFARRLPVRVLVSPVW
jgi:hypothetical protein